RSRRLSHDAAGHHLHRELRQGDLGPGADPHGRYVGSPQRRRLSGAHRSRRLAMPSTRAGVRGLQYRSRAGLRQAGAAVDHLCHRATVSQPRSACRWRRAVAGASASGTQIACEIARSGRPVMLAVGEHIRAPRMYRGKDLEWWMDAAGVLDERYDAIDIERARRVPSLQLAGTPDRSTLDLNALT